MGLFTKKTTTPTNQLPPQLQQQLAGGPLVSTPPKSSFVDRLRGTKTNSAQAQQDQLYQAQLNNQKLMKQNAQQNQMGLLAQDPMQHQHHQHHHQGQQVIMMSPEQYAAYQAGQPTYVPAHSHTAETHSHHHHQQPTHIPPHHHDVHLAHQTHHGHLNAHDVGVGAVAASHHHHAAPHAHHDHHAHVERHAPVEVATRPAVIDVTPHAHETRTVSHEVAQQDLKTCIACGRAIEGYYADYYGSYYHSDCLERTRERRLKEAAPASGAPRRTCAWSGKPITGYYVEFYGHAYLPECFESAKPADGNWPVDAVPHATEEVIAVPSEHVHHRQVLHSAPVEGHHHHHHHVDAHAHVPDTHVVDAHAHGHVHDHHVHDHHHHDHHAQSHTHLHDPHGHAHSHVHDAHHHQVLAAH